MRTPFRKSAAAALVLLCLCGAGCPEGLTEKWAGLWQSDQESADAAAAKKARRAGIPDPDQPPNRTEYWNSIAPGMEREVISIKTDDPKHPINVTMHKLDLDQFTGRILSDVRNPKSTIDWSRTLPVDVAGRLVDAIVVNGTYFNEDRTPTGFLAVDGQQVGTNSFDLDKSGLIVFAPEFRIIDTATEPVTLDAAVLQNAMQSFPFLISDGQPMVKKDSGQLARRTFIGTDQGGSVYFGSVTDSVVSLYQLMNILIDSDVRWKHVLNLDGGTSTGYVTVYDGAAHAFDSYAAVPSAIGFVRKAADEDRSAE